MGIYDRNYMREEKPEPPVRPRPVIRPPGNRAPLWARIKFRLWLWFHRRG